MFTTNYIFRPLAPVFPAKIFSVRDYAYYHKNIQKYKCSGCIFSKTLLNCLIPTEHMLIN